MRLTGNIEMFKRILKNVPWSTIYSNKATAQQ